MGRVEPHRDSRLALEVTQAAKDWSAFIEQCWHAMIHVHFPTYFSCGHSAGREVTSDSDSQCFFFSMLWKEGRDA
jgi:hypothetical protein